MRALSVFGVGLWLPGYPDAQAWLSGEPDPATSRPEGRLLPGALRRRASLFTRANADAYAQALAQARLDAAASLRMVFAAAFGEMEACCALLKELNQGDGRLSPIHFSSCVHNTAAGKIAIATGNRSNANSVAAGPETVQAGIWEAAALLAEAPERLVAVFGDAASDDQLIAADKQYDTLAVALVLGLAEPGAAGLGALSLPVHRPAGEPWSDRIPKQWHHNPCVGALRLADRILRGQTGPVALAPDPDQGAWVDFTPSETR